MTQLQPPQENPFLALTASQTELAQVPQSGQAMEQEPPPLTAAEIDEARKKDLGASYEELANTELTDLDTKRSLKGLNLLSEKTYKVKDVLVIDKANRTISRKALEIPFQIKGKPYVITMHPKDKDNLFINTTAPGIWRDVSTFVATLIAQSMLDKGIIEPITQLFAKFYSDYMTDDNNYIQEASIDCFTKNGLSTRYGYSCLIRLMRKYVNAFYAIANEVWKTAEGIAFNVGYEKVGTKKFSARGRTVDIKLKKEKAMYKQLGGTWTTQLKGGRDIPVYIHGKGERSFSSILYDLGETSILGSNLALIERSREGFVADKELVETMNTYKLIKQFNALTDKSIENIPLVPLYIIDNVGIWDISDGKTYKTFKPVSLSSVTGLRMPAIVSPNQTDPIPNFNISVAIEKIVTDAKLNGYNALTAAVGLIGQQFKREMKVVRHGVKKPAKLESVITLSQQKS